MTRVAHWTGRFVVTAGLGLWACWLVWRLVTLDGVVGAVVLVLEMVAFAAAAVLSAALWSGPTVGADGRRRTRTDAAFPVTVATAVGLHDDVVAAPCVGADDTGEVGMARRGLAVLDPRRRDTRRWSAVAEAGWAVVATDGIRRMAFAAVLAVVLLTGRFPFDVSAALLVVLVGSQFLLAAGHGLLSGGLIVPGARMRWSMASVGAGLGDGTSRSGLPIRWTATLATMVVLNLAVALRGVSDRWTHGLGAMPHDQRVVAMVTAGWLVAWGFAALRTLPAPELGYYGATRRLEEPSTRRLALGATLTVAAVGMIAGILPAGGIPA